MDRLETMALLLKAVEAGSLSAAGRSLGLPLATLSRKISDLEAHLGARLLIRSARRLELTDAGRSYALACKRILEEVDDAERAAGGEYRAPKGELTITAPIVFGRLHGAPVIAEFLKAYPEIDVRLLLGDRIVSLVEDRVDLAIRIGDLPDSSLVARRIGAVRRVICASPAYFAARGAPLRPEDLSAHDCISFEAMTSSTQWRFGAGKARQSVPVHSRFVVNTAEAAIEAAIAGVGLTCVLSYQAARALADGSLALALEDFEPPPSPVNLVHAGEHVAPLKLRAFLDFAAPRLRDRLALAAPPA
ncbi:LysR family transcriptional regulator [Methylocella silvestris]|uniref:LysR family transcriptional regulator n=1 Tax=Methylocella silvestris TaxID=199596 RepID=A0A2J7TF93_METSI|nr:LysR family transcriptional regulator [Methylocella silvestris]PNG25436.1 LysR family transcriptional regulator [Methylocella silvestris]